MIFHTKEWYLCQGLSATSCLNLSAIRNIDIESQVSIKLQAEERTQLHLPPPISNENQINISYQFPN